MSQPATDAGDTDAAPTLTSDKMPPALTGNPLLDLQMLSVHQLASALSSEQPRTCAILLSNLPAKLAGDVLSLLRPESQKLVMKELTESRIQQARDSIAEIIAKIDMESE